MATPNIKLNLVPLNILNVINEEVTDQEFVLKKLADNGDDFELFDDAMPVYTVDASSTLEITLSDNLYKITFFDTFDDSEIDFFVLADHNIKMCEKNIIKSILCVPAKDCDTKSYYKLLEKRQRFYVMKNAVWAIYGRYVGQLYRDSVQLDVINTEIGNFRVYLDALLSLCGCTNSYVDSCASGELVSTNWLNLNPNCNCG